MKDTAFGSGFVTNAGGRELLFGSAAPLSLRWLPLLASAFDTERAAGRLHSSMPSDLYTEATEIQPSAGSWCPEAHHLIWLVVDARKRATEDLCSKLCVLEDILLNCVMPFLALPVLYVSLEGSALGVHYATPEAAQDRRNVADALLTFAGRYVPDADICINRIWRGNGGVWVYSISSLLLEGSWHMQLVARYSPSWVIISEFGDIEVSGSRATKDEATWLSDILALPSGRVWAQGRFVGQAFKHVPYAEPLSEDVWFTGSFRSPEVLEFSCEVAFRDHFRNRAYHFEMTLTRP